MNNLIYIYQNNWNDLLTLITYLLKNKIKPFNIKDTNYNATLFEECLNLNLKQENIVTLWQKFLKRDIYQMIYYVYLSNQPNKELIIYYFLLNYIKYKDKVIYQRNLKCVNQVLKISNYVKHEAHKLKGFIRFREINNFLVATISPENNVIEILANHFKKRLQNEQWLIIDNKHNTVCFYKNRKVYLLHDINLKKSEDSYEKLWKTFFKTIAIKERENKKTQQNFMPKKYWSNMIEMEDEL